jgi:succinyl-diaminopimelate desuccinylase
MLNGTMTPDGNHRGTQPETPHETAQERARWIAQSVNADEVIALTRQLVQMDSVASPGRPHEEAVARLLEARLHASGFKLHWTEVLPQRPNIVADWVGTPGERMLILEGHTDVVIEGDRRAWTLDPFGADIIDGKLFGRGSADMKGGLAAAIVALETVARFAPDLPGHVRLLIPCDEEGMMTGIKRMVHDGWHCGPDGRVADGAIICEPEELELCLFQRGGIRVRVTFIGKQAHGAMPYAGLNPIPALARFVLEVRALQEAYQNAVGEHPMLGRPWLTPTVLMAGSWPQLNVMHADASLGLDIRTVPGVDHAEVHDRLKAILHTLEREEGVQTRYEVMDDRPWTATDANARVVQALEQATRLTLHREPRYGGVPGTTDGTFLHKAGVPIVTVGPGDREIPHQVNEFVRVDELISSARLYAAAIVLFMLDE